MRAVGGGAAGADARRPGLRPALIASGVLLIALGSYPAARDDAKTPKAPASTTGESRFPALPDKGVVEMSLNDFSSRAVWDTDRTPKGHTVRLHRRTVPRARGPLPRCGGHPGRSLKGRQRG
ncbi:hypothetical protein [Streptomyces sparsogenes]|uniref:hypothetical protein n=1 Tax=Streptomyces sparsogenes TaxID=67365 RepID=UPI0033C2CE16